MIDSRQIDEFLDAWPQMALRPKAGRGIIIEGRFEFRAHHHEAGEIQDAFEIEIEIPSRFPKDIPEVRELGGRIPRNGDHHVNEGAGTFCMGSPIELITKIAADPTLTGFARSCLIPYLFGISYKLANGDFPFGELAHHTPGALEDYKRIFGVETRIQARECIKALSLRKRLANKLPCPCYCGRRLGRCRFNQKLQPFRSMAFPSWYRRHAHELGLR